MPLVITPEAEALVDVQSNPIVVEIEKYDIRTSPPPSRGPNKPDPAYYDEATGEASEYGSSSLAQLRDAPRLHRRHLRQGQERPSPSTGWASTAGSSTSARRPSGPATWLTGRGKLANLKESPRDDGGAMLLVTFEGNFTNQDGADVLTSRMTLIWMYGKEDLNG